MMSKIDDLIAKYCSNGVEYKEIGNIWVRQEKSKYGVAKIQELESGDNICFTSGNKTFFVKDCLVDGECLFMNDGGVADIKYHSGKAFYTDHVFAFGIQPEIGILTKYVYYCLKNKQDYINEFLFKGAGLKNLNKKDFAKFQIPVPPLAVQEEIVNILDSFTMLEAELEAELEARKKQYEHYRDELLNPENMKGEVQSLELGALFPFIRNGFVGTVTPYFTNEQNGVRYLEGTNIHDGIISDNEILYVTKEFHNKHIKNELKPDDILMVQSGHICECAVVGEKYKGANCHALIIMSNGGTCLSKYIVYYLHTAAGLKSLLPATTGGAIKHVLAKKIGKIKVPVPSLAEQERIVSILDKFDGLVNDISDGLPAEINARRQQYEYYRDKLLNFEPIVA